MGISSTGVGSGLDVESIITSLMTVEKQPQTALSTQKTAVKAKISAYGQISSALSTLQTAVASIATASKFNAQTLTSGDTSVFTATSTSGSASSGSHSISVSQLAQSQKLVSSGYTNTTDTVGTGTLTISFPDNSSATGISITIDSSNNTLEGIKSAINDANGSVTASIVNDGSTNKLVLTSKDSGAKNDFKVAVTDGDGTDTDTSGLSALAYDPSGTKNLTQSQVAQDAKLNVDGIDISKTSNTITDAIDGVTLTLLKTSTATTTTDTSGASTTSYSKVSLNVATDTSKITTALQSLVTAYNSYVSTMKTLTKFDSTGVSTGTANSKNGTLIGDATARTVTSQIKNLLNQSVTNGSTTSYLSDAGITFQSDGTLSLDTSTLSTALSSDFNKISKLFVTTGSGTSAVKGLGAQLKDKLTSLLGSDGIIQAKTDGYNKTVTQLTTKISDWDTRLAAIEKRYRATYTALDTALTNMKTLSSYITSESTQWTANS